MEQMPLVFEATDNQTITEFTRKAYLNYSMYVILDRALPHIADGLKPVQRRIIYAMSEIGLSSLSKPKKSARTVGDVLGKYHPHGDSACYEAMVLMAQPFTYRYPLIDGQGNWGSIDDPKSFAAMRYTESKLSRYADILLHEVKLGTVTWHDNFDGTLKEPKLLPAQLPNILLNGSMGIAVGMATDIPPHNLNEVVDACLYLLDNNAASIDDIFNIIPAPDYPGGAEIITSKEDRLKTYSTGNGSIKQRAVYNIDDGNIIITALPHQVSGGKILEQIASQMRAKKLPWLADLRDESDHLYPIRLVLVPRSNRVNIETLMLHLFASTDLEKNYRINLNIIGVDGRPKVFSLIEILHEWLEFRKQTVINRLEFRLDKVLERLHALDGFLIAFLNIDEVIAIIRYEDNPKNVLKERFSLTDRQAESILELKLRHIAKLEEIKIQTEKKALEKERKKLESYLNSPSKLKKLLASELLELRKKHGDKRRSLITERKESIALKETDFIPVENITVLLSQQGWVRSAKGHNIDLKTLTYKSGDNYLSSAEGKSNNFAAFIDNTGKIYSIPANEFPSARGQGEPITGKIKLEKNAHICNVFLIKEQSYILFSSSEGYGFISNGEAVLTKNRSGKQVVSLKSGGIIVQPIVFDSNLAEAYIALITNQGHLLILNAKEVPLLNRGKGNKLINMPKAAATGEILSHTAILSTKQSLTIYAGKRYMKISSNDIDKYLASRGGRGKLLPRGFQSVNKIMVE